MGKKWLPAITDKFAQNTETSIANGSLEWKEPIKHIHNIWNWYNINSNWQVISKAGNPMKYTFKETTKSPYVVTFIRTIKDSQ